MRFCSVPYAFPPALAAPGLFYKISIIISREKCNCKKNTGFRKEAGACRQCAKRSAGQQLKMIPLGDQQPFLLQLGKLHRHGGAFHAEKIRQLLTVKGNIKGKGGLPDGFGGQVGQQLFPVVRLLTWVILSLKSSILFARTLTRLRMSFW